MLVKSLVNGLLIFFASLAPLIFCASYLRHKSFDEWQRQQELSKVNLITSVSSINEEGQKYLQEKDNSFFMCNIDIGNNKNIVDNTCSISLIELNPEEWKQPTTDSSGVSTQSNLIDINQIAQKPTKSINNFSNLQPDSLYSITSYNQKIGMSIELDYEQIEIVQYDEIQKNKTKIATLNIIAIYKNKNLSFNTNLVLVKNNKEAYSNIYSNLSNQKCLIFGRSSPCQIYLLTDDDIKDSERINGDPDYTKIDLSKVIFQKLNSENLSKAPYLLIDLQSKFPSKDLIDQKLNTLVLSNTSFNQTWIELSEHKIIAAFEYQPNLIQQKPRLIKIKSPTNTQA